MISEPIVEALDETESLSLIAGGGVGRIGYTSRFGPAVLPVNYDLYEQTIVFRTGLHSTMVEDLRTGIADAEYNVAFEIDHCNRSRRRGGASWSRARRTSWTPRTNSPRSPGSVWRRGRAAPRSSSSASSPGASPAGASGGPQRLSPTSPVLDRHKASLGGAMLSQPDQQADGRPWPSRMQVAAGAWASRGLGSNGGGCWPSWAARSSWSWGCGSRRGECGQRRPGRARRSGRSGQA